MSMTEMSLMNMHMVSDPSTDFVEYARIPVEELAGLMVAEINDHGWVQKVLFGTDGEVCVLGAMDMAKDKLQCDMSPAAWPIIPSQELHNRARRLLAADGYDLAIDKTLACWNDEPSTTKEDVLLLLKRIAAGEGTE